MRVYRAKDGFVSRHGCKDCHDAKIRFDYQFYNYNGIDQKRKVSVISCPYFKGSKSFKEFIDKEEYKAQFELETGLDMNDLRGTPGDIPLSL